MTQLSTFDSSLGVYHGTAGNAALFSGLEGSSAPRTDNPLATYSHANRLIRGRGVITLVPKPPAFVFGEQVVLPVLKALEGLASAVSSAVSSLFNFVPGARAEAVPQAPHKFNDLRQTEEFPKYFNLKNLNGTNGFVVGGLSPNDKLGFAVSGVGDINGDKIDDFALGAPALEDAPSADDSSSAYVLLGTTEGWPSPFPLKSLNGTNGFAVGSLLPGNLLGYSISGVGDVNGDGLPDFAVGAPLEDSTKGLAGESSAFVLFGSTEKRPPSFDVSTLNGTDGFAMQGPASGDGLGTTVSGVGDVNGDGLSDFAVAAAFASPGGRSGAGTVYIVFGRKQTWPASLALATLDGTNGFRANGLAPDDTLGSSCGVGDVNGDGVLDFALGAPFASPGGLSGAGTAYIVFGRKQTWPASLTLSTLDGTNGFTVNGLVAEGSLGFSMSGIGDVNGDGLHDMVLGTIAPDDGGGAYVLFGRATVWPASVDLAALNGKNGFVVQGLANDFLGYSVSGLGDINGDKRPDFVLGAPAFGDLADQAGQVGAAYVFFGRDGGWPASVNVTTLDGANGFAVPGLTPRDGLGQAVGGIGDINGDGVSDLAVGAPDVSNGTGATYIVFGMPMLPQPKTRPIA